MYVFYLTDAQSKDLSDARKIWIPLDNCLMVGIFLYQLYYVYQDKMEVKRQLKLKTDEKKKYDEELEEFNKKSIRDWTILMKLWKQSHMEVKVCTHHHDEPSPAKTLDQQSVRSQSVKMNNILGLTQLSDSVQLRKTTLKTQTTPKSGVTQSRKARHIQPKYIPPNINIDIPSYKRETRHRIPNYRPRRGMRDQMKQGFL